MKGNGWVGGKGGGSPTLYIVSSWIRIRLHAKHQLPRLLPRAFFVGFVIVVIVMG